MFILKYIIISAIAEEKIDEIGRMARYHKEEQARQKIDSLLEQAGWVAQDRDRFNLGAKRGVAIREFSLSTGATDDTSLHDA
jgi:hypothetical protein